jgi:hypothetical protein
MEGLFISGLLRGFRARTYNDKVVGYELGVAVMKDDGFGGQSEEVKVIRVNEKQQAHVQNAANRLTGKTVLVPVYESAYAGRGGAVAQLNYVPDSPIIDLTGGVNPFTGEIDKSPTKAA